MKKRMFALLAALCLLPAAAMAKNVTDMFGREIEIPDPVSRVVVLSPADCEILCALGGEELLVGRGAYCNFPASIEDVPVVESGAQTNIEQILALAPQVVVMSDMAQTLDHVNTLQAMGIQTVVLNADDIDGAYQAMRIIGRIIGREDAAQAMVDEIQGTLAAIRERTAESSLKAYFEISPLQWGLWTAGGDTFLSELAEICGLKNCFADVSGWAEISGEQVLLRDPDVIVSLVSYGDGTQAEEEIPARAGWQGVSAVRAGRIFPADNDMMTRPGPRLQDAALALYAFVYGETLE